MDYPVRERVIEFIKLKHLSVREFERLCSLSNGYVKGIKHTIRPNKLRSIIQQFPDLNSVWVLTGEGGILREAQHSHGNDYSPNTVIAGDVVTDVDRPYILISDTVNKLEENLEKHKTEIENLKKQLTLQENIIREKERYIELLEKNNKLITN